MIRTLDRYLLSRFIISLVIAVGAITLVALIVDLVEHLEDIVDNAPGVKEVILYYIYFIPWIYKVIAPAVSAQKPPMGFKRVMRMPIVLTMRHPPKRVPNAIAIWQPMTTMKGT